MPQLSFIPKFVTTLFTTAILALFLRFFVEDMVKSHNTTLAISAIVLTICIGIFVILKIAEVIEQTTAVLKNKTGLAGGLLQSFGTAFPDMVLGIMAAFLSLQATNPQEKISFAIIAASATFGSNLYNVGHAAWCVYRQNKANHTGKNVKMFLFFGGDVIPMKHHKSLPRIQEIDNANGLIVALSVLTFVVVTSMVLFGKTTSPFFEGDLYQLTPVAGVLVLISAVATIYFFRKNTSEEIDEDEEENKFVTQPMWSIIASLVVSGVVILFTAESMVSSIQEFSFLTGIPEFATGVAAGFIGCLGEMVVVHNFTVNPKGRLGDAIVGVGMDNIVTVIGASIVALMGGLFLGGSSLILIFIGILTLNCILIWQNATLKNEYTEEQYK